jgi:hypothetical protein
VEYPVQALRCRLRPVNWTGPRTEVFLLRAAILGLLAAFGALGAEAQVRDRISRIDRLDRAARAATVERSVDRTIERRQAAAQQLQTRTGQDQLQTDSLLADQRLMRARDGYAARRGEILALDLSDAARTAALNAGMTVISESQVGTSFRLARLNALPPLDPGAMLDLLRTADPTGVFDFNHAFATSGPTPQITPAAPGRSVVGPKLTLGMIDGGVLASHPDLARASIRQQAFPETSTLTATDHGTAVAGRLADTLGNPFSLLVADVLSETGSNWTGADAIASGFAWLSSENVRVINISLAGPPNAVVEQVVRRYLSGGGAIIAAVGNGGPFSALIYPAAYSGVTGVTAVDKSGLVWPLATTGPHVDRQALGVDVSIAVIGGHIVSSGTSWAAPVIAAEIAAGAVAQAPALVAAQ